MAQPRSQSLLNEVKYSNIPVSPQTGIPVYVSQSLLNEVKYSNIYDQHPTSKDNLSSRNPF